MTDFVDGNRDVHSATSACATAIELSNLLSRYLDFLLIAEGESKERHERAEQIRAPAIHQMCQISAKPVTTAKNALTKPIALFFGISIGSYSRACAG